MPSFLDFNTTKVFRDFILGKTLSVPNGPKTFNSTTYSVQNLSDFSNIAQPATDADVPDELTQTSNSNIYKPSEFFIVDSLDVLPRRANLSLYPYFVSQHYTLYGILNTSDYSNESELLKFAANEIKTNPQGPVLSRIQQNVYKNTVSKNSLLDTVSNNTSSATNLLSGRQPITNYDNTITVDNSNPTSNQSGQGQDLSFLEVISGQQSPFVEIPGDYLSNPANPLNYTAPTSSQVGSVLNDLTGILGSLLGIQTNAKLNTRPSDLFVQYMGLGTQAQLFNNLSYSKYSPDYSADAMQSSNASALQTSGAAYIGDDRGNDVYFAMNDFNDRPVVSGFYLSLLFDPVQTILFQNERNVTEGGAVSGKLTWISANSKNKIGANNNDFASQGSSFGESLSTNYTFRPSSILDVTQTILNTLPTDAGASRSHVANAIDQTSRIFREGDYMLSRGSAIKYTNQFTGVETGVEYCRVWTKDRPHLTYGDTMKRIPLIRQFDGSILDTSYNINIAPMSNGGYSFNGSTNIIKQGDGFYAKKYMFSIENLVWKSSNIPNFTYNDLPFCERGANGGRVMWFPPYDLKVSEQSSAKWEENNFLGRPEPIYTYQNTSRSGQISFKVVVDHPSIMNLLLKDFFKGMSDEEADNYINAIFAGCQDLDFYSLIRKYVNLNQNDIQRIQNYLNNGSNPQTITANKNVVTPVQQLNTPNPPASNGDTSGANTPTFTANLYFPNNKPDSNNGLYNGDTYTNIYNQYSQSQDSYLSTLNDGLNVLSTATLWGNNCQNDYNLLYGTAPTTKPDDPTFSANISKTNNDITVAFTQLNTNYSGYVSNLTSLKNQLQQKTVQSITVQVSSSASAVADANFNLDLSFRRSYSVILDFLTQISNNVTPTFTWPSSDISSLSSTSTTATISDIPAIKFTDLGYDYDGTLTFEMINNQGEFGQTPSNTITTSGGIDCSNKNFLTSTSLQVAAPIAFYCRESTITVQYTTQPAPDPTVTPPNQQPTATAANTNLPTNSNSASSTNQPNSATSTPPLDELKRIIMKLLTEGYYFKKLEDDSPIAFSSLREKLRYFHPAFHSTTPEGLNTRLTFLQQCVRPGDTIPIKGISDTDDLNARNTTFGPPPICVIRVGDFFNSKVIIRDVNIEYDEGIWDLNPEGIGVQPMIANVTLQVNFIGGHGLEAPIEKLQNALSSNFYANTEIYDFRSTETEDTSQFTKEFLEGLMQNQPQVVPSNNPDKSALTNQGEFIGDLSDTTLNYNGLLTDVYTDMGGYYDSYKSALSLISTKYGAKISSLFFSPTYRTVNNYTVQTGTGTSTIQLLGQYNVQNDLTVLTNYFRTTMVSTIANTNISSLIGIDKDLTTSLTQSCEDLLNPYVQSQITTIIDGFTDETSIGTLEGKRNQLISDLDKLNFLVETGHDGFVITGSTIGADLSGFTYNQLTDNYTDVITYITNNDVLMTNALDGTYTFGNNSTISNDLLSEFLSILLSLGGGKQGIMNLFSSNTTLFTSSIVKKIDKRITTFLTTPTDITPTLKSYPTQQNTNDVSFDITDETYVFGSTQQQELINIFSTTVPLGTTLNFYKP